MSYSTTDIICKKCGTKYQAALNGVFQINGEYAATCHACDDQTFFTWGIEAAPLVATFPKNSSPIYFVKVI